MTPGEQARAYRGAAEIPKGPMDDADVLIDAEFRRTGEGLLRHPAFKGIRRDLMD
jgi:hypothetical protein